jgi:hypothetical protein
MKPSTSENKEMKIYTDGTFVVIELSPDQYDLVQFHISESSDDVKYLLCTDTVAEYLSEILDVERYEFPMREFFEVILVK